MCSVHRKILLTAIASLGFAATASAADLPARTYTKAPVTPAYVAYNWSGFYLGGNLGWAFDGRSSETPTGTFLTTGTTQAFPLSIGRSGFTGGGQFGYNWQTGPAVFGFEADFNYLGFRSKSVSAIETASTFFGSGSAPNTQTYTAGSENFFGTVRGRIGYAWDRTLLYATGGFAYGTGFTNSVTYTNTTPGVNYATFQGNSGTSFGWTIGAGLEYALGNNWSIKGEYLYVDLSNHNRTLVPVAVIGTPATGGTFADTGGDRFSIARVGFNYKFGGPIVAKY
jgi:outer membrane immunogenic protein